MEQQVSGQEVAEVIDQLTTSEESVKVSVSNQVIHLLSDQLYQSPLKAVEELVVNSYDADAKECRIQINVEGEAKQGYVITYDNGKGMDHAGLVNLWQIGTSNKRNEDIERYAKRKQIGKFGIGKLATATIAHKLTYISKNNNKILSITVDYRKFSNDENGQISQIEFPVKEIKDFASLSEQTHLCEGLKNAGIEIKNLEKLDSWTIAILEELREKAQNLRTGELSWVLRTAMPLQSDFKLYLNGNEVRSSKEDFAKRFSFKVVEIDKARLEGLKEKTGDEWRIEGDSLKSRLFPAGITGEIIVSERNLIGKSDDIQRSKGFFIKVRNRLVNEEDELFGLDPLFYGTFNKFRADINADDLDSGLKASREAIEESQIKSAFRALLRELFNEANTRIAKADKETEKGNPKREGQRNTVYPQIVEYPVADVLFVQDKKNVNGKPKWYYLEIPESANISELVNSLYNDKRANYKYLIRQSGRAGNMASFDPTTSTFWLNTDHEFVKEYVLSSRALLEDAVTAEVLLEVYLRDAGVSLDVTNSILAKRDYLLRSLAKDHLHSPKSIEQALIDSQADEYELEINLVVAARTLGFEVVHIAGAGEPDGIAKFTDAKLEKIQITLEAKSSVGTPSLGALDFAGLEEHMKAKASSGRTASQGCLLIAPSYPNKTNPDGSAVAVRATEAKISCWTIKQLADVVSVAEERHYNAEHILNIVLNNFTPTEVSNAVESLLKSPEWNNSLLYEGIISVVEDLLPSIKSKALDISMIWARVQLKPSLGQVDWDTVDKAVRDLASASQGGMNIRGNNNSVVVLVSPQELRNRLHVMAKVQLNPRRISSFKSNE